MNNLLKIILFIMVLPLFFYSCATNPEVHIQTQKEGFIQLSYSDGFPAT